MYVRFYEFLFRCNPAFPALRFFLSLSLSLSLSLLLTHSLAHSHRAKRETGRINRGSGRRSSLHPDVCTDDDDDDNDDGDDGSDGDGNIAADGKINGRYSWKVLFESFVRSIVVCVSINNNAIIN